MEDSSVFSPATGAQQADLSAVSQVTPDNVTADTILGDVNEDGDADIFDVVFIQRHLAKLDDPEFSEAPADLDRDGDIKIFDVVLLQRKLAGPPVFNPPSVTVSNLNAPDTAQSGTDITVSGDLENTGEIGALQDIEFRIAPEGETLDENDTLDEKFVDMAPSGISSPVDRPSQTTITFDNVTLPEGNYTHGIFSDDDSATGNISVEAAGGTITGDVSLDTSSPNEDVNVTVTADDGNTTYSETVTIAGSDDTATYTLAGVDENVGSGYTVSATSDSNNYDDPADATVTVAAGETVQENFTFTRQTGGANGTVVASGETSTNQSPGDREGIENATIDVYAFQGDDSGSPTFSFADATDANGEFDLADTTFPVGDHFVVVDATNFTSVGQAVTVSEGSNDLGTIALNYSDAGEISGSLTLGGMADPGEDVEVTVTADDGDNTYTDAVWINGSSDTATYTLSDVDVNVDAGYTVSATAGNYADASAQNVTVDVGETVTQDFTLNRLTGSLDGTVTNVTAGQPIQGATVNVSAFGQSGPVVASETTDASGNYSVPSLPVGDHYVTVTVDGAVADTATVSIMDSTTTPQDFNLTESSFDVSILSAPNVTAGQTQSFDVEITNTGDLIGGDTVSLDWGSGQYSDSVMETLAGGDSAIRTLSVDIDATQAIGFYEANVSSEDDFDTEQVAIAPGRSLNTTSPDPGTTVEVTVTARLDSGDTLDTADAWTPDVDDSSLVSTSFTPDYQSIRTDGVFLGTSSASGTVTIVYEVDVPSNAGGTVFEWEDDAFLNVGGTDGELFPILGDDEFTVTSSTTVGAVTTNPGLVAPA